MDNRSDVIAVLKNWKKLPEDIKVSSDLTPLQRKTYKNLKAQAYEWNLKNPNSRKTVIYIKGNPTLVTEKKPKKSSAKNQGN